MTICKGQIQKGLLGVDKHTSLCFLHYWLDWNRSYWTEIKNHVTKQGLWEPLPGFRRVLDNFLLFSFIITLILQVIEAARLTIFVPQGLQGEEAALWAECHNPCFVFFNDPFSSRHRDWAGFIMTS